jgi:hypothetical protein
MHWQGAAEATNAGYDVIACPGPGRGRPPCPLLHGGSCPLVDGSDAVVVVVAPERGGLGAQLVGALAGRDSETPVVIDARVDPPAGPLPRVNRVLVGCRADDEVTSAVRELLEHRSGHDLDDEAGA